jgi:hypothetical protein
MKKFLLAIVSATFALNAAAAELSFNNLGLGYQQLDFDCDTNCDGFRLNGSLDFNETFGGAVDFTNYEGDVNLTFVTLRAKHMLSDAAAIYGEAGVVNFDTDFGDETEAAVGVGVRGMATESLELDFNIRHIFADNSDQIARLTGTYFFTDTVGGSINLDGADGVFGGGFGVRVNF